MTNDQCRRCDDTLHGPLLLCAVRLSRSEFAAEIVFFALNLHEADLACNAKLSQRIAGIYQWPI